MAGSFDHLLQGAEHLEDPWRGRLISFLEAHRSAGHLLHVGDRILLVGKVEAVTDAVIEIAPLEFCPGRGFAEPTVGQNKIRIYVPGLSRRSALPVVDDEIVCHGKQIRTECWDALALAEDTIIIPRAHFKPHEPFHVLHLFAGGFGGWSRAMHWLAREVPHISIATELFVDNDDKVMDVWSYQTGLRYHKGKSVSAGQVNLAAKAGLCTSVDDPTILHCWKCASNSVATASPPCISWSQGGKRQGLSCSSGFAMAETVMLAEVHQPLLLFLECADTTVSHEHFPLVENMLHLIGYRKVWHQVVAMHHLSNNSRSRWLAVWARVDLALRPHEANFDLRAPPLVKWNDPSNEFWTPESFHCQLQLSAEALSKYGNPGLLPPAKRARTNAETSTQETLQLRLADTTQPLPTLCSSYTRQHLLQAEHVMAKGIFASLQIVADKVCFLCPTRFVPLFGTTDKIVLPSDASFAFHILGNAITQSQATLCLAVGFQALLAEDLAPVQLVQKAWEQRLTSQNALVQVFEQWLTISRVEDIAACMVPRTLPLSFDGPLISLEIEHCHNQMTWQAKVPPKTSLSTAVILTMFTKGIMPEAFRFRTKDHMLLSDITLKDAFAVTPQVLCFIWDRPLVSFRPVSACPHESSASDAVVSPTLPFTVPGEDSQPITIETSPPFQPAPEAFQALLRFLEFNTHWHPATNRSKQLVSLLWEAPPGVLTVQLDTIVPAADLQEQLATHFGAGTYTVFQSPFALPKIAPGPLFTVRLRNHPNDALVVFQKLQTEVWVRVAAVPKQIPHDTCIIAGDGNYTICSHNNRPCSVGPLHIANGDLLIIEPTPTIHAGGHHRWTERPESLPRGANFTDRIAFAINTHGWVASDELHSAMTYLTRHFPETIAEFNLLRWNSDGHEFDDELYGEPRFASAGRTVTAILVDNHWASIEVNRIGNLIQVHAFGLTPPLANRAIIIMCRLLDIAPHRAQQHIHAGLPPEHLCGWFLLFRYYRICRIHDTLLSSVELFNELPPTRRAEIREAWESGQEDWRRAGANDGLLLFATNLRTHFLTHLAATATQTSSVVPVPLSVQFRAQTLTPETQPPTSQPPPPEDPAPLEATLGSTEQPEPEPVRHDPVHHRLLECLQQPGWLSSDVLDHALDLLRWQFPQVCFCPPAVWRPELLQVSYLAGLECLPETFSNLIVFILWQEHWIVCEVTVHAWEAFVQTIGPIELMPDLTSIVAAVCMLFQIQDVVLNTATTHFRALPGLYGWTLLWTLFQRFQTRPSQASQPLLAALRAHPHYELIQQIQLRDHAVWENAEPALLEFASAIQLEFMTRIIQNRVPSERARGGALTDVSSSSAPVTIGSHPVSALPASRVFDRLQLFDTQPGWLFSDTADYLLDFLRQHDPDTAYLPPMQWTFEGGATTFNDLQTSVHSYQKIIGLVLWNTHWILCEVQSTVCAQWIFLTGPAELRPHSIACATAICEHLGIDPVPHIVFRDFQADPHLCGWTLLWLCFQKAGVEIHHPGPLQESSFLRSIHHAEVQRVLTNAAAAWQQPVIHQAALFAMRMLPWHLLQVLQGRFPKHQAPGGAGEAKAAAKAKNSQRSGTDPLIAHDPWAKAAAVSSRWEDLKLEDHHPFQDAKGEQLCQYHRLQTTMTTKGVVLTTKQYLPELIKLSPKQPLVAILPLIDQQTKVSSALTFHGPFEVVLEDRATKASYKRVVSAVALCGEFQFKLSEPACEFTMSEVAEVVLELDSRLVNKAEFDRAQDNPIWFFKQYLTNAAPDHVNHASVYGFRHNRHPSSSRDDDQLQVLAKLPCPARAKLLTSSGTQGILVRDFLDQGTQPTDTTVIPKFWEVSLKGLRELNISIEGLKGAAGATLTRRGLAVRAWCVDIADVRRKLLPMDARLNDTNIKVVPKFMVDASGWPPGASPADVIETVAKAVSQAPIPTRTFRAAGVHTWQLGFQTLPTVLTFTVKINGALHQILLTPTPQFAKGGGKGKNRQPKKAAPKEDGPSPPAASTIAAASAQHEKKRLDHLETRFETLQKQVCGIENKQTTLESKLDQRFNDIGDTLRQLVQLSSQRTHESTGDTPPPKTQRTL